VLAQRIGIVASIIFVAISALIIFNTIRMAIFSRKEEIQMMKLIGADKSFIRGPFVVEAIVYGFIAALLATILGYVLLIAVRDRFVGSGVEVQPTLELATTYGVLVLLGMIALGAIIGTVSSLLATRRYLKI
jgi:cell division transport system permease protein